MTSPHGIRPVFILGVGQRSGTNYLYKLLGLHPDCFTDTIIGEDFLVNQLHYLERYVRNVYTFWPSKWDVPKLIGPPDTLCKSLGDGLLSFLYKQLHTPDNSGKTTYKKFITKSPSVRNLALFHKFFPEADLIIVLRDGRSLVESGVRSFEWKYETAMRKWAKGAREIDRFTSLFPHNSGQYLLIRYEDIYSDMSSQMSRILSHLGLDSNIYNFESARNLPVFGSSDMKQTGDTTIDWRPATKSDSFSPLERWSEWSTWKKSRYRWLCGSLHLRFGYNLDDFPHDTRFFRIVNHCTDMLLYLSSKTKAIYYKSRTLLGIA